MRTAVVILLLGVVIGAYLFYVRGMGVQPATSAPQAIERQGDATISPPVHCEVFFTWPEVAKNRCLKTSPY
jgi:hypothetical protein